MVTSSVVHIKSLYPSAIFWIESFGVSGNSESLGGVLATISPPTEVFALINNRPGAASGIMLDL